MVSSCLFDCAFKGKSFASPLCLSPIQACSSKSLERLRSQQEGLRSLKPQVVYLRDLAQGLVQDAPQTLGGSSDGAQRLQEQARGTEKEYDDVTDKVRSILLFNGREAGAGAYNVGTGACSVDSIQIQYKLRREPRPVLLR